MKIKFINFLVSILYVPLLFIGQFIGNIFGTLLSLIILNFDLLWFSYFANLLSEILFMLIGGIIGGYICGYLISKIYKNYNLFYISIFPFFITLLYLAFIFIFLPFDGVEINITSFGDAGACILSLIFFYYFLKENLKKKKS
tara:strand:+ start:75 stop:500 length:426 start_codon:yes stop_codon:yes gene_type:complete